MSERNEMLDICDMMGEGSNLWFVVALLGALGLNLLLTCILCVGFMRRGGGGTGSQSTGDGDEVDDLAASPAKGVSKSAAAWNGGGGDAGDLKKELLQFKRSLEAMDRKIDNKRVNEITASYLLHNAHDAIGNHVPTAAQVLSSLGFPVTLVNKLSQQTLLLLLHASFSPRIHHIGLIKRRRTSENKASG